MEMSCANRQRASPPFFISFFFLRLLLRHDITACVCGAKIDPLEEHDKMLLLKTVLHKKNLLSIKVT